MAYTRGSSSNIIVGAAALFTFDEGPIGKVPAGSAEFPDQVGQIIDDQALLDLPAYEASTSSYSGSYRETLTADAGYTNVGYTMNGLEIQFQPDFGEVQVDQVLDVAKLYKQGMQVNLNTAFAEATLENLLFSLAAQADDISPVDVVTGVGSGSKSLNLSAGDLGECPVERGLVAVGPGTGDCEAGSSIERIYVAYRALSIDNVTVAAKRDEATMFEVSFRLLPNDDASYGKIVDRIIAAV